MGVLRGCISLLSQFEKNLTLVRQKYPENGRRGGLNGLESLTSLWCWFAPAEGLKTKIPDSSLKKNPGYGQNINTRLKSV